MSIRNRVENSPINPAFLRTLHLLTTFNTMTRCAVYADNPERHARSLAADTARLNEDFAARIEAGTFKDDLAVISFLDRVTFAA